MARFGKSHGVMCQKRSPDKKSVKKEWSETKSGIKNAGKNAKSSSVIAGLGKFIRISFGIVFLFFSILILAGFIWVMLTDIGSLYRVNWREIAQNYLDEAKNEAVA